MGRSEAFHCLETMKEQVFPTVRMGFSPSALEVGDLRSNASRGQETGENGELRRLLSSRCIELRGLQRKET